MRDNPKKYDSTSGPPVRGLPANAITATRSTTQMATSSLIAPRPGTEVEPGGATPPQSKALSQGEPDRCSLHHLLSSVLHAPCGRAPQACRAAKRLCGKLRLDCGNTKPFRPQPQKSRGARPYLPPAYSHPRLQSRNSASHARHDWPYGQDIGSPWLQSTGCRAPWAS